MRVSPEAGEHRAQSWSLRELDLPSPAGGKSSGSKLKATEQCLTRSVGAAQRRKRLLATQRIAWPELQPALLIGQALGGCVPRGQYEAAIDGPLVVALIVELMRFEQDEGSAVVSGSELDVEVEVRLLVPDL